MMMEGDQAALQSLSSDYLSLLGSGGEHGMLSDITFCVEGRQVPAHRCILAARSHFFRLLFAQHQENSPNLHQLSNSISLSMPFPSTAAADPLIIPVDVVGFDAFSTVLRFLYSGQLILPQIHQPATPSSCPSHTCSHTLCSYAVDFLLELIHAAHFFGIHELSELVQTKLGKVLEEGVSVESLMRVLAISKRHRLERVWLQCVDLIIRTGINCDTLRKYLPREVIAELADARLQRSASYEQHGMHSNNVATRVTISDHMHSPQNLSKSPSGNPPLHMSCCISGSMGACCSEDQRILRLQQALDCMDVELVRLMVMGEGLDLDKALALHYSVANCNREVVKALLELGVVDVNHSDSLGRTALHLAAGVGNAEMIAVLLDHHANPNAVTHEGFASIDILRSLMKSGMVDHTNPDHQHSSGVAIAPQLCKADQKRLHLCIELLQSAAAVAGRDDAAESSCVTTQAVTQHGAVQNVMMDTQLNIHHYIMERSLLRPNVRGSTQLNHEPKASRAVLRTDSTYAPRIINIDGVRSEHHQMQPIITSSQHNQDAAHADGASLFLDLQHQNHFPIKQDLHNGCVFSPITHDYRRILENLQADHHPQNDKSTNTGSSSED